MIYSSTRKFAKPLYQTEKLH